jgi:HSP20 family molecular chaperone IbpA
MLPEKSPTNQKPEIIEPVTTLRNDGKFIHIVSKLPGFFEEKIKIDIDLEKTTITIVAENTTKIYKKIISLPGDVVFSNKRFSDGELTLTVEKRKS